MLNFETAIKTEIPFAITPIKATVFIKFKKSPQCYFFLVKINKNTDKLIPTIRKAG